MRHGCCRIPTNSKNRPIILCQEWRKISNFMNIWRQMEFQWNQESGIRNLTYCCCPGLNMDVSQPLSHCLSPSHPLFFFSPHLLWGIRDITPFGILQREDLW
jgi:hypothetical protein